MLPACDDRLLAASTKAGLLQFARKASKYDSTGQGIKERRLCPTLQANALILARYRFACQYGAILSRAMFRILRFIVLPVWTALTQKGISEMAASQILRTLMTFSFPSCT